MSDLGVSLSNVKNRALFNSIGFVLVAALWAALPLWIGRSSVDMLVFTALYAIAGLGVSFLLGQCGMVSLAQSAFFGIGAYSTAYGTTVLAWSGPLAMVIGVAISGAIAAIVGIPVLRLSGFFLALATLALAVIAHVLFLEWEWLTGGTLGIGGIPKLSILGYQLSSPVRYYYFIWPVAIVIFALHRNVLRSRTGYAMRAMRDAPAAAAVLGINLRMLKVKVFVLSGLLGSLAGSLFAHYVSFVNVDSFGLDRAVNFLVIAVLGGINTIAGVALGALFVTAGPTLLSRAGDVHPLLFALALVAAVIYVPGGFGGAATDASQAMMRWIRRDPIQRR